MNEFGRDSLTCEELKSPNGLDAGMLFLKGRNDAETRMHDGWRIASASERK